MIRKYDPFKDMYEKMQRMFENLPEENLSYGTLPIDVEDNEDNIVVKADMPGVEKDNINVKVRDQTLQISAENRKEVREQGKDYIMHERSSKSYSRRISLPSAVNRESFKAEYRNGVLRIEMKKKESNKDFEIKVE